MTIAQALAVGVMRLRSEQAAEPVRDSARADAQILLGEVLQLDGAHLLAHGEEELDADLLDVFGLLLGERMRGVPVAYLTHKAGFYGREFYVDETVLVPRPESENLVEAALVDLRTRSAAGERLRALDVGTGSGALAITLAAEIPELTLCATDVSPAAIAIARRNARELGVAERITFVETDLVDGLAGHAQRFDCVVANLPYVPSAELPPPPNPVGFEPVVAVDGGEDGLALYRRLLPLLPELVAPRASLYFEAAPPVVYPLASLVQYAFVGGHIEIGEDYAELERFVAVSLP
ncbi:MAG: peptide chain release factor N(5)-glutamine methyltransferase [Candidatus Eremiobacteraeota bacterium]|nr:peptide chain release factor N(5)-glutamine methyltransferase [Candidatus Eremiobacteraeota bacterium]